MSKRFDQDRNHKPWKLLLWTAVAGLIFGLIGAGEYFEDMLRVARNNRDVEFVKRGLERLEDCHLL